MGPLLLLNDDVVVLLSDDDDESSLAQGVDVPYERVNWAAKRLLATAVARHPRSWRIRERSRLEAIPILGEIDGGDAMAMNETTGMTLKK